MILCGHRIGWRWKSVDGENAFCYICYCVRKIVPNFREESGLGWPE